MEGHVRESTFPLSPLLNEFARWQLGEIPSHWWLLGYRKWLQSIWLFLLLNWYTFLPLNWYMLPDWVGYSLFLSLFLKLPGNISLILGCHSIIMPHAIHSFSQWRGRPKLTIRSGGGVLRMKHLIWPFSPWRACWVCVLEMIGGPGKEGERKWKWNCSLLFVSCYL